MLTTKEIFHLSECDGKFIAYSQHPVFSAYLDIESRVLALPDSILTDIYNRYLKLIHHYFIANMGCEETSLCDDASFVYLLNDLPNKLIARDCEDRDILYKLDSVEYRTFLFHINRVWPETLMELNVPDCTYRAINNVYRFLTSKYNDAAKRQVIDFELVSPGVSLEPKLYPVSLSTGTLLRMVKPGPMLGLLENNTDQHYGLMMSELDIELFKLYMWTGLVGKPNFAIINRELRDFVIQHSTHFENVTLAPVEFKHLNGVRYEPFPHDKKLLCNLLETYIPNF